MDLKKQICLIGDLMTNVEAICFVTTSNALQYCFNVVFLFYNVLVINVVSFVK